jgi:predicted TPR repeat methyltransferase
MNNPSQPTWLQPGAIPKAPQEVESKYDAASSDYDVFMQANRYEAPTMAAQLLAEYASIDGTVLDVGCGTGLVGQALHQLGFSAITGTDISQNMLAQAANKQVYRELTKANLLEPLPYAENQFDAIVCVGVFSRFDNTEIMLILKDFMRVAKGQAYILFTHREDLMAASGLEDILRADSRFSVLNISQALPYLPNHADGYTDVGVHYILLQVA